MQVSKVAFWFDGLSLIAGSTTLQNRREMRASE